MIQTKTKEEIQILREGGRRLAVILITLSEKCISGQPVRELNPIAADLVDPDKAAFFGYQPQGAKRPYPDYVCVSVNDEIVHGIPTESDHVFADGDVVSLDMGLVHKDLIVDSAITFVVGEPTKETVELITTCKQALHAGINQALVGNHVGDISAAIEKAIDDKYSIFPELVGHGVGYEVHEDPVIPNFGKAGYGDKLPIGAVLAIEPMIGVGGSKIELAEDGYLYKTADNSLSAHFEHTIAVTENGPLILTKP